MAIFTNYATLSYGDNTINSNVVTGEIEEALSMTKTALDGTYVPGDTVAYVINIVNSGVYNFTNLTFTDNLGAYDPGTGLVYPLTYDVGTLRYFVDGVLQPTPTITATQPLTAVGLALPSGSTATVVYQTTVNNFAPPTVDGSVINTVTLTGTGITTPLTADETITAEEGPRLTITKSLCPQVVTENGQLTYTFTIENFGNTAATPELELVLTDTFNPALDLTSVSFNGTPWTSPENYSYTATTGLFTTNPGEITVPAATFTQNPDGSYTTTPGTSTLVVIGNII